MRRMLLACVFAVPFVAHAQDLTLPERVVTATRIPTLIERIPAGVTVIDRATIEARGYASLSDALSAVPGARMVASGGLGGTASLFVRGTNSNHVLVLRDGVPVNDPSDPGGLYNFGVDSLADVERIEVVRGPMAGIYGSGAIGGVVNIISRKAEAGKPRVNLEIATGLPRALKLAAGISGRQDMVDYKLGFDHRAERGFDTTPQRMSIYNGARNGYKGTSLNAEIGVTPVEGTRIFLGARARTATFGIDNLGFPIYDAHLYRGKDDSLSGRAGITSKLLDGRLETSLILSHLVTHRHYTQPLEAADPNQAEGNSRYRGERTILAWEGSYKLPDAGPAADTSLLFGLSHQIDGSRATLDSAFFGAPYRQSLRATAHSTAGHVGIQTTLFDRLTLTGDARQEEGRYGGGAFTWRSGGVLAIPEAWSRLKASYGTGFRAPSLYDLFGIDNSGYAGNPRLRPERSTGWEAGAAIDLPAFGRKDAATLEWTWFDNSIRDLIQIVYNPSFTASTSQNVARARSQGYEAAVTLRPADWLEAQFAYTLTDARNLTTRTKLLRRPREQLSASARITPLLGLTIAPEVIYTGAFQDFLYDDTGTPTGPGRAKSGAILNLTVSYEIKPGITAYIDGRNLTGSRFETANGYQTPGARVLAGVRAGF